MESFDYFCIFTILTYDICNKFSKLNGLVINGKYDKKMLPKYAKSIVNKFQKLGVEVDSVSPEIGHGMPLESRSTIKEWINSILSEQSK